MATFVMRRLDDGDRDWAAELWSQGWCGPAMMSWGVTPLIDALPRDRHRAGRGGVGGTPVGLVNYHIAGDGCEIVSLDSPREGLGVGSALIAAVRDVAAETGLARLWLVATNENLSALRFYQKRDVRLTAEQRGAATTARQRTPPIPVTGIDGIPLRDEIELGLPLGGGST